MAKSVKAPEMKVVDGVRFRPEHVEVAEAAKAARDARRPAQVLTSTTGRRKGAATADPADGE